MKNKRTPDIRFTGFTDAWGQRRLKEISDKVIEKNKDNLYSETLTNSAEFGIINQRDFFDKDISNEKNLNGYYVVREDDFVYNPRISNLAPVGPIKRNKLGRTGVMSPLYFVFRTHDIDKSYLDYYFDSTGWHNYMKLNGDSGARADRFAIKDSVFTDMPIPYPSYDEQAKIGSFFKELDHLIFLYQRELTTLKQTKQGFLQKMFPREGESVPEVRFPGFTDAWEQRELGEVVTIKSGWSPSNFREGTSMYVKVDDLNYSNREQNDSQMKVRENSRYSKVKVGSTIFPKRGAAIMTNKVRILAKDSYMDTNMMALEPDSINSEFLYMFISRTGLYKIADTSTIPQINNKHIEPYEIMMPSIEEQAKIGEFFRNLDHLITLHQRELDALKETKSAFLQKMFV